MIVRPSKILAAASEAHPAETAAGMGKKVAMVTRWVLRCCEQHLGGVAGASACSHTKSANDVIVGWPPPPVDYSRMPKVQR